MQKIDIEYTDITNSTYNDSVLIFLEGKKFAWVFRSISTHVALYPVIIEGKDTFVIRTRSYNGDILEIADSFKLVNVIIKRETCDANWLDDDQINKVKEVLKDIEKIDITEVLASGNERGNQGI